MKDDVLDSQQKFYMSAAIDAARECFATDDVPVGAVIVRHGEIIAVGRNTREKNGDATCHAETEAIREACRKLGGWHLTDCEMYVTLEPCPMCAGAIINSRIDRVIIGAIEPKGGAFGGAFDLSEFPFPYLPQVVFGVCEEECAGLLKDFFREKRSRGKRWTEKTPKPQN